VNRNDLFCGVVLLTVLRVQDRRCRAFLGRQHGNGRPLGNGIASTGIDTLSGSSTRSSLKDNLRSVDAFARMSGLVVFLLVFPGLRMKRGAITSAGFQDFRGPWDGLRVW
jgi:hypothetical protein